MTNTLRTAYAEKKAALDALLGKGAEITAEDIRQAEVLNADLDRIQAGLELEGKAARHTRFQSETADALPLNGGQVLGTLPAGETVLDPVRKGTEVSSIGEGMLDAKQLRAIQNPEYKDAFRRYLKGEFAQMTHAEQKTLQEGLDPSGGFLAPEDMLARIIMKQPTPTRVVNYVSQFNTGRDSLAIPRVVYNTDDLYTTGIRVTWTGEIPASATAHRVTDPVFGQVRVPVYTAMLSQPVTNDLLEDSAANLDAWLAARFSETIELLMDDMILNGSGVGQPMGVLVNPGATDQPATVNTGNASALTADGIQSLGWSLPEQYDEMARFVMNKTNTAQALAKLKDGNGRYFWGSGMQDSGLVPTIRNRQLLGYDVNFSGFMPNVGSNTYPIIFGDFRGYYLVRRVGFSIQVLRELYAETNQVLLLGRVRFGGVTAEPWRLKIQKVSA